MPAQAGMTGKGVGRKMQNLDSLFRGKDEDKRFESEPKVFNDVVELLRAPKIQRCARRLRPAQ